MGAVISFSLNQAGARLQGPQVSAGLFGVFPTVGQTIEDRYGSPLSVTTDIQGQPFTRIRPGPLANLRPGENTIAWSMPKSKSSWAPGAGD